MTAGDAQFKAQMLRFYQLQYQQQHQGAPSQEDYERGAGAAALVADIKAHLFDAPDYEI